MQFTVCNRMDFLLCSSSYLYVLLNLDFLARIFSSLVFLVALTWISSHVLLLDYVVLLDLGSEVIFYVFTNEKGRTIGIS